MTSPVHHSVVLTGCGWVTPFAAGSIADVLNAAAVRARSASDGCALHPSVTLVGREDSPQAKSCGPSGDKGYWAVPPDPPQADFLNLSNELKRNKGAWMAAVALEHACRSASLSIKSLEADRVGLTLGCGLAGQLGMIEFATEVRQQSPRFVSPIHFPQTVGNYIAGALARSYDIRGPNVTLASGPASGLDALTEACALVARGRADVVLAGGTEQLSDALANGLEKPDTVLSEGACFFVVERTSRAAARGVKPLAWVRHPRNARVGDGPGPGILSVAGCRHEGAIFIEHWVGLCIGACGAAAVAAAIGAANGHAVPMLDPSDQTAVTVATIAAKDVGTPDGVIRAKVLADTDGAQVADWELDIGG